MLSQEIKKNKANPIEFYEVNTRQTFIWKSVMNVDNEESESSQQIPKSNRYLLLWSNLIDMFKCIYIVNYV